MKKIYNSKIIQVTLKRSIYGRFKKHKFCVLGLGLRKIHQKVKIKNTPENIGMINKVRYLLKVEEI